MPELLLSNSFSDKHVPMATIEQATEEHVFCAVRAKML
jgi:hypothetical protein